MLTDIFATRYADVRIFTEFGEKERRLIVQGIRLLEEQISPYYDSDGKEIAAGKAFWKDLHSRLSMELGLESLSPLVYSYEAGTSASRYTQSGFWPLHKVCGNWRNQVPAAPSEVDAHLKERLSLVELGFRLKGDMVAAANANLETSIATTMARRYGSGGPRLPGNLADSFRALNRQKNDAFDTAVLELNARLRQAGCKLHYHNGFIQLSEDTLVAKAIEEPFWKAVAGPNWVNVDTDMKEAFDRRDNAGRDPVFYAARALESTLKIISGQKGWTHGGEKGPHNFVDNLSAKKAGFIEPWEADLLKTFFTNARNPFGHGPGAQPMPTLTAEQTDWAIETSMAWIRSLIRRARL